MKRSKQVALTLMATSSLTLLAGCGRQADPVEAARYATLDQCLADGKLSEEICRQSYQEALAEHGQSAPRYDDRRACEAQFGVDRCEQSTGGTGSFWTPFFMGWVASSVFDRVAGGPGYYSTPVYRPGNARQWYTPTGTRLDPTADGTYRVNRRAMASRPPVAKVRSRTRAVSRGGFTRRSSRSYGG